jgi:threonine synthase
MAEREGIFCEPASAACVAGLLKSLEEGKIERNKTAVCVLTGHGLKDPSSATEGAESKVVRLPAEYDTVKKYLLESEGLVPR